MSPPDPAPRTLTVAFDVYGTLVDPLGLAAELRPHAGDQAQRLAELWRQKQIEYSFRRALMRRYADFDACTAQALDYSLTRLGLQLTELQRTAVLGAYRALPAYPEAGEALAALRARGHNLVAFSNGTPSSVAAVLRNAKLTPFLEAIVSVDSIRTFKPAPEVYGHLAQATGAGTDRLWMVSANAWDAMGARAAGLHAAWVRRSAVEPWDPWEIQPDLVVSSLADLPGALPGGSQTAGQAV